MYFCDFYSNVLEEAKGSFIFNTVSESVKTIINSKKNDNFIYNQVRVFKENIEKTHFNIIYSSFRYFFDLYSVSDGVKCILSMFLSSYLLGLRNGNNYAIKSGIFTCMIYLFNKITNQIKL